jgi:hypothetical protein
LTQGLWNIGYIVLFISVLAAFVYGAFLYTSAGVNAGNVSQAKDILGNAVIGLVIGLSVVIVIRVINPSLLTNTCEIESIVRVGNRSFTSERLGRDQDTIQGEPGAPPGQPGGPGGPLITPDGSFASGLFTGPASTIGSGTEYHIDSKFPKTMIWEQIDAYFLAMAQGYAANNRRIEFSNRAGSCQVYDPNAPQSERIAMLQRAAAAHAPRPLHSFNYYVPLNGTSRWSSSVRDVEMILPSIPGGRADYASGGRYGHHVRVYDANGNFIYTTGHGNDTKPLPRNITF